MPRKKESPPSVEAPPLDDGSADELEDLATLDVDATVSEVMIAVHWVEEHTPGLGAEPVPTATAPVVARASRRVRRRSTDVRARVA